MGFLLMLHSRRNGAALLSSETVKRAERHVVRPCDDPHAGFFPRSDTESFLGQRLPQRRRAIAGCPGLPDGLAHARKGQARPLGPRAGTRRHGGSGRLRRLLAPDARCYIGAAGALQFGNDSDSSAARRHAVPEVRFKGPRCGFEADIGTAVVKRAAVRADVR
ncbi:hypothetical protein [Mesorhizobium sophorae]|uniref:hypothetical protein n=1 Tax=Mesorhizobium sophorae TaxID=1300294 RepID=UPI000BA31951|nr:hypothetical protein [Mesorhizobium sophorae]